MYHLTEEDWCALDYPDPSDYPGSNWEDDGEGGFYITHFPDINNNSIPDFLESIVPSAPDIDLRPSQRGQGI